MALLERGHRHHSIATIRVARFTQGLQNEEWLSPLEWRQGVYLQRLDRALRPFEWAKAVKVTELYPAAASRAAATFGSSASIGTPGNSFEVRIASADLTWLTLGAGVRWVVRNF
jgi:hypothetical protein